MLKDRYGNAASTNSQAAIAKYDEGLKRFPKSSLLKNNREYCEAKKKQK